LNKPLTVGINGCQGIGKTTLVSNLAKLLEPLKTVYFSLDDIYLPMLNQKELSESHPSNPLLAYRGNAGTHSVDLAFKTLDSLISTHQRYFEEVQEGQNQGESLKSVKLPRYDKSAFQGKGDRVPEELWPEVSPPYDIILFEGWMLGFVHEPNPENLHDPHLKILNEFLKSYEPLYSYFSAFIQLKTQDLNTIYDWRLQAEKEMKKIKGEEAGMTDNQVRDFVDRFMPGYRQYLGGMPTRLRELNSNLIGNYLTVTVNPKREIVLVEQS